MLNSKTLNLQILSGRKKLSRLKTWMVEEIKSKRPIVRVETSGEKIASSKVGPHHLKIKLDGKTMATIVVDQE
jgi:hypothetical protein